MDHFHMPDFHMPEDFLKQKQGDSTLEEKIQDIKDDLDEEIEQELHKTCIFCDEDDEDDDYNYDDYAEKYGYPGSIIDGVVRGIARIERNVKIAAACAVAVGAVIVIGIVHNKKN